MISVCLREAPGYADGGPYGELPSRYGTLSPRQSSSFVPDRTLRSKLQVTGDALMFNRAHPDARQSDMIEDRRDSTPSTEFMGYAKGGLASDAARVSAAGRGGDSMMVHLNPEEYHELCQKWGQPTINPHTGQPEFFLSGLQKWFSQNPVVGAIASIAGGALLGPLVGGVLGGIGLPASLTGIAGSGLAGAGIGALTGGGKGALIGGLGGAIAGPYINNAFGGSEGTIGGLFNSFGGAGAGAAGAASAGTAGTGAASGAGAVTSGVSGAGTPLGFGLSGATAGGATIPGGVAAASPTAGLGLGSISKYLVPGLFGLMALGSMSKPKSPISNPPPGFGQLTGSNAQHLQDIPYDRARADAGIPNYYTYGTQPGQGEASFFKNNALPNYTPGMSRGGFVDREKLRGGGGVLGRISDGRSDDIHLRNADVSHGEYVMDAESVSLLGNGDNTAGAKHLDELRVNLRKQKGAALAKGKISPNAKPPEAYMKKLAKGGKASSDTLESAPPSQIFTGSTYTPKDIENDARAQRAFQLQQRMKEIQDLPNIQQQVVPQIAVPAGLAPMPRLREGPQ